MLDYLAEKYGSLKFEEAPELRLYAHNSTYDGSFMLRLLMNLRIWRKTPNTYLSTVPSVTGRGLRRNT